MTPGDNESDTPVLGAHAPPFLALECQEQLCALLNCHVLTSKIQPLKASPLQRMRRSVVFTAEQLLRDSLCLTLHDASENSLSSSCVWFRVIPFCLSGSHTSVSEVQVGHTTRCIGGVLQNWTPETYIVLSTNSKVNKMLNV